MNAHKTEVVQQQAAPTPSTEGGDNRNGNSRPFDTDPKVIEDWLWILEQYPTGVFVPYFGQTIAVVDKAIQGAGPNASQVLREVCRRLDVPADRVVLKYID